MMTGNENMQRTNLIIHKTYIKNVFFYHNVYYYNVII